MKYVKLVKLQGFLVQFGERGCAICAGKTALHEPSVTEPLLYISVLSNCLIGARGSVILFSAGVRNRPARKRIARENFSHTLVHGPSRTDESRKDVLIQGKMVLHWEDRVGTIARRFFGRLRPEF